MLLELSAVRRGDGMNMIRYNNALCHHRSIPDSRVKYKSCQGVCETITPTTAASNLQINDTAI